MGVASIIPHLLKVQAEGDGARLMTKFFWFALLRKNVLLFSSSFFILYLLNLTDYEFLGVIFAISFIFEAFTDYPTGVLSDRVGYRKILFFAFSLYGLSYYLLTIVFHPYVLLGILILQSLANGQESGALQSWFDNNYHEIIPDDPDNEHYTGFLTKTLIIADFTAYGSAVLGGFLAVTLPLGRSGVFLIQSVLMFYVALLCLVFLGNYYMKPPKEEKQEKFGSAIGKSLKFLFKPKVFLISLGLIAPLVVKSVWVTLLLYPIYYGYSGSEFFLSILNIIIFGVVSMWGLLRSNKWKKLQPSTRLPLVKLLNGIVFFGGLYYLVENYQFTNQIELIPLIIIIVTGFFSGVMLLQNKVFSYKLLLHVVPNDMRNSYYSLLPTIALLGAAFLNYFGGEYISQNGFGDILLLLAGIEVAGAILLGFITVIFGIGSLKQQSVYDEIPYIFDNDLRRIQGTIKRFRPSHHYIGETSKIIWEKLMKTANLDENVSDEELKLMILGMGKIQDYLDTLENALRDGYITPNELKQLEKRREQLQKALDKEVNRDKQITGEERALLETYSAIIKEFERLEQVSYRET